MGEQLPLHQDLDARLERLREQLAKEREKAGQERNARLAAEAEIRALKKRLEQIGAIVRGEKAPKRGRST